MTRTLRRFPDMVGAAPVPKLVRQTPKNTFRVSNQLSTGVGGDRKQSRHIDPEKSFANITFLTTAYNDTRKMPAHIQVKHCNKGASQEHFRVSR